MVNGYFFNWTIHFRAYIFWKFKTAREIRNILQNITKNENNTFEFYATIYGASWLLVFFFLLQSSKPLMGNPS